MSAFYSSYPAKNELSWSLDTNVPVIELQPSTSLVRPLSIGSNWNSLWINMRLAYVGSNSTGNLTGRCFIGVCNGTRRYQLTSAAGGALQTHALGWSNTSLADGTYIGYTDTKTNPANQIAGFRMSIMRPCLQSGSTFTNIGSAGEVTVARYETAFTSAFAYSDLFGTCFTPVSFQINRVASTYVMRSGYFNYFDVTDRATCSVNLPAQNFRQASDFRGDVLNIVGNMNMLTEPFYDRFNVTAANSIMTFANNNISSANTPKVAEMGDFDSFNVYFHTTNPSVRLLIKDLLIYRSQ